MPANQNRRTNRSFVMISRAMLLRNEEWKGLSSAAKIIYLYLKAKYNGSNNGNIRLYYSELNGIKGISSDATIARAFRELETNNWVRRTRIGGMYRYFNEYRLTGEFDDHVN